MSESNASYRTSPEDTDRMPSGIPYIVSNEAAERFSFYGMKCILTVFMMNHLLGADGEPNGMTEEDARTWYHGFVTAVYFFPLLGALIADLLCGKYRLILWLSMVYVAGHAVLAVMDFPSATGVAPQTALFIGLALISIGSGGIKPCVTAHVGDQFGKRNSHLLETVFGWFYFSINFGAALSTLATPWVLEHYGPGWAFGIPGVLMAVATIFFWMGRNRFAHIPAKPRLIVAELTSSEGIMAIVRLIPLYFFVAMFWALFDQTGSAWVQQADRMNLTLPIVGEILPSQVQVANPILVLSLIPLFTVVIYPFARKYLTVSPLRKIGVGMFLAAAAFALTATVESWIDTAESNYIVSLIEAGELAAGTTSLPTNADELSALTPVDPSTLPNIGWQLLGYFLLTTGEVLVSITFLEFSYTQAPRSIKSVVMSLAMLSISLGNVFVTVVNWYISNQTAAGEEALSGPEYYWFFVRAMLVFSVGFVVWSCFYKGKTYLQDDADPTFEAESEATSV